jgi:hypothetical protein
VYTKITLVHNEYQGVTNPGYIHREHARQLTMNALVTIGAWILVINGETSQKLRLNLKKTSKTVRKPMAFIRNGGIKEESTCQTMECAAVRWNDREGADDAVGAWRTYEP